MNLIQPEEKYYASYREAIEEYRAQNVNDYAFTDAEPAVLFEKFRSYAAGVNLKHGRVAATYYWLVDGDEFVGEIAIRHSLNDALRRYGGHIGYGVRCSRWNQGCGTVMLGLALEKAREMGMNRVLITCDDDNIASARVIEKCGGVLQDKISNVFEDAAVLTRRYWIEL